MPNSTATGRYGLNLHAGSTVSPEVLELGRAVQAHERRTGRRADAATVLRIAKSLGWRKGESR